MNFPVIRSGELFGTASREDRAVYFDALAAADVNDVAPFAYYGHNGWARMTAGMKPEDAAEMYFSQVGPMSVRQRRDFAYGNALSRFLDGAYGDSSVRAADRGFRTGVDALSGGRKDLSKEAVAGQFDPDAATSVLMKSMLGGD